MDHGFLSRLWTRYRHEALGPPGAAMRIVVFSDPDTLRPADGPRRWALTEALTSLERRGIAVVLWGNETRSELELIQSDLDVHHPFVSESGGGLFIPRGHFLNVPIGGRVGPTYHVLDFGRPYGEVADRLRDVAGRLGIGIIAFSEMSVQDVAYSCGLSLAQARLAKLREYDEPFRFIDADPATRSRLFHALRRAGLRCFAHDGFHHATSVPDKTASIRALTGFYRAVWKCDVLTVGLARHQSETCLLHAVDIPYVISSDAGDTARLVQKVPIARFAGSDPDGWSDAILRLVDRRAGMR